MRAHGRRGVPVGCTLVAALVLTAACGDGDGDGAVLEDASAPAAEPEDLEEVAAEPAEGDAPDGDDAEPQEADEELDPLAPGTELEASYLVDVLEGGVPCPSVELDDGTRFGVMSSGFPMDADGRPTEAGHLIDVEGRILLVQPDDWVEMGTPEGEVIASDGDRVRLTSGGSMPLESLTSRAGCGDPDDELLIFASIEAIG